jgi:hypothetical protein
MDMMMLYSEDKIDLTEIPLINEENVLNLLTLNNESIYYILSSLSPSIKRIY